MWFRRPATPRLATPSHRLRSSRRLQLEALEDRVVPSIADGSLLVATGPSAFSTQDQSSFPTGIIAVDSSGGQTPVSVGGFFSAPRYITESSTQQLYVADLKASGTGAVIQVDPNTGQQTLLATGGFLDHPIALTFLGGSLYVVNQGDSMGSAHSLVQIDPNTGQQTLITSGGGFVTPTGIAPAPGGNVYVADQPGGILSTQPGAVWLVNVSTGQQTAVTTGGILNHPVDVAVEPSGTLIVVSTGSASNGYAGSLARVDPQTGSQKLLSTFPASTGLNKVVIGSDGTILVGAISNGVTPGRIYAVNPATGTATTLISGGSLSLVEGLAIFHASPGTGGGLGDVSATLDPSTGLLAISGGNANDAITIVQSAPGVLQVSNAGASVSFALSLVNSITIQLLDGNDQVTITGVSVPGDVFINAGAGTDTFIFDTISAGRMSITASGADTVSVLNSKAAGILHIGIGAGSQAITVTGDTVSDLVILANTLTGDNLLIDLENDNITNPNSGGLSLVSGNANVEMIMTNLNIAYALTVDLGGGANSVVATNVTALFGFINGGSPNSGVNVYIDGGGNGGYIVYHFIGH